MTQLHSPSGPAPHQALPRRRQLAIVGVLAVVVIIIASGWSLIVAPRAEAPEKPSSPAAPGTFTPTKEQWAGLKFETVATKVFRPEQTTEGNIAIDDDLNTQVFSPYSGRVTKLIARLGDTVEQGAPLMAVEATEFVQAQNDLISALSALKTAQSQLNLAQIAEKRNHDLYLANGGALKDWQQSQADLVSAQNGLRSAEIALAAVRNRLRILGKNDKEIAAIESAPTQRMDPVATVPAPIAGTVIQRQVGLGQNIQSVAAGASTPVYTIGDLSTVWLVANLREADAGLMRLGEPVEVRVLAYPGRVFRATISWVAPSIDANTHRLLVRADVENPDGALKPNMFGNFTIVTGEASATPAVPQEAVVYEGETARVWVAGAGETLALREIRAGSIADSMVEVLSGLSVGDKVVTSGSVFIDRAAKAD
jgi:cobalt-zinc-cadmium efflux system membrane fusion protein